MKSKSTKYMVQAAAIAGIYAALTLLLMPISYGPLQVRISEVLSILPCVTPAAIPGLFVGCLIGNVMSPYGLPDLICGSLATLLAAFFSYKLRNHTWLAPLPPVIANGVIIGAMLHYIYGVPVSLGLCMLWVAAGEAIACYGLGIPLLKYLKKRKDLWRVG